MKVGSTIGTATVIGVTEARLPGMGKVSTQGEIGQQAKRQGATRHKTGTMNKLEAAMSWELDAMLQSGKVTRWRFESVKVRLASATWYTPDFQVWLADGRIVMLETKGHPRDDAMVKFKVAREQYPEYLWLMLKREKGRWKIICGDAIDVFETIC